jgi:hypothetical protein
MTSYDVASIIRQALSLGREAPAAAEGVILKDADPAKRGQHSFIAGGGGGIMQYVDGSCGVAGGVGCEGAAGNQAAGPAQIYLIL